MTIIHFSGAAGNIVRYCEHPSGGIIGSALISYEGRHQDNQFRWHDFPAERIQLLASNTNAAFNQGLEVPLKFDHNPSLLNSDGSVNKFGKMASAIACRPITQEDLINPRLKDLVGKLGAFAEVHILSKIDEVKNKTIQAISAGIDPVANKIVEISAVEQPGLAGAALLFSQGNPQANFSQHGLTDYDEAWKRVMAWKKPHQELQERFDVFVGTLQAIAAEQEKDPIAFNPNNLNRKALEAFVTKMVEYLGINMNNSTNEPENIYSSNPYAPEIINSKGNFSAKSSDNILNFELPGSYKKRLRKKA